MSIEIINDLAMRLVAEDFSNGHKPTQGGPTKTSRAMALIHLAAHDAYAQVTGKFPARLGGLPSPPSGGTGDDRGTVALLAAGFRMAEKLYPDFGSVIAQLRPMHIDSDPPLIAFGVFVADAWWKARAGDGSGEPQEDTNFDSAPGRHRPDPFNLGQTALGRTWGSVQPFVLTDVPTDAPLGPPPKLTDQKYADAFKQVYKNGSSDLTERDAHAREMAAIGIFWGYDGSNKLGTPPRLYNQIVRGIPLPLTLSHDKRVRLLTAVNVAMADAGIAAWYWKYQYDLWRPVVAIREADAGFGPTGRGDGNTLRIPGNPFWRPLGAPRSNPIGPRIAGALGENFTPNFPAYPSGHATFGTACFETAAKLLGKKPKDITVKFFVSDEFNGMSTDNNGVARPRWEQDFTLQEAIKQNSESRIFLGVHWIFDATGGETIGKAIAAKVAAAFA